MSLDVVEVGKVFCQFFIPKHFLLYTDQREENGLNVILYNSENFLGGWPVLESNPGGNFDGDNVDLTNLLTTAFNKFASSSLIHAEAVPDPDDPTKFKMMVGFKSNYRRELSFFFLKII